MLHATTWPSHTDTYPLTLAQLRQARDENRTRRVDNLIVDKQTGEIIGCYVHSQLTPEPYSCYPQMKTAAYRPNFTIFADGTPLEITVGQEASPQSSADIIQFPEQALLANSNAGRPVSVLTNPLAGFLQYFNFDGYSAYWIDDRYHRSVRYTGRA